MSNSINIEIVSDFACPWCFVGKRYLDEAIEQRPELDISLAWSPFQLNPDMPRLGRNRRDYYRAKFGDARASDLWTTLREAGAKSGIEFGDSSDAIAPNTLSAHVLMSWAAEDENIDSNTLAEKLFHAHHIACENIGDKDVLMRAAGEVGMDAARVGSRLAMGDDEDEVQERIQQSVARGVSGVPVFIVNNEYAVSGAQPSATLVSVFDQVSN